MRRLTMTALAAVAAATAAATPSAAPDAKPPRIVSASMIDADRDSRADGVRLVYSERVRHGADRDGRYPFAVAGYRVRTVGAASGRTVVLTLVELQAADDTARPALRYRRSPTGKVLDLARNEALGQLFRAVRPHGNRPPANPPPPPTSDDRDNDGVADAQDCAPADPAIRPGAPDRPDLAFVDSNCDGIDGDESKAIFVSPLGKDANAGSRAAPKREIDAAVAAAAGKGKVVLAAAGTYQRVKAASGVGIYGGYDATTWRRSLGSTTTIAGSPEGVYAERAKDVELQLLTVRGTAPESSISASAYGIRAVLGSELVLRRVFVHAGNGSQGTIGEPGSVGRPAGVGGNGFRGRCDFQGTGTGGASGTSPAGSLGGRGGAGGHGDHDGFRGLEGGGGTPGGDGGVSGNPGRIGEDGKHGAYGAPGERGSGGTSTLAYASVHWAGQAGGSGKRGAPGKGGGGGGGGGGQSGVFAKDGTGNGGGGGGGGGEGGAGGEGGTPGGGSFGIYLFSSTATVSGGSSVQVGNGAMGGPGGKGGNGGAGGRGGYGITWCNAEVGTGGDGGNGGRGGVGGGGGGGAGGPSIGVLKAGTSTATLGDTTIKVGTPGRGGDPGLYGEGGTAAQAGIARPIA